jgi:hypothetical protein
MDYFAIILCIPDYVFEMFTKHSQFTLQESTRAIVRWESEQVKRLSGSGLGVMRNMIAY